MKKNSKTDAKFKDCFKELQDALPEEKGWIRNEKEISEDYLF